MLPRIANFVAATVPILLLLLVQQFRDACGSSAFASGDDDAPAMWSRFGLVVQRQTDPAAGMPHTTETSGIIIRAPDPPSPAARDALGKSWTQISVTPPPRPTVPATSAVLTASTPIKFASTFVTGPAATTSTSRPPTSSTQVSRMVPSSKYKHTDGSSKPMITITFPPPSSAHTVSPSASMEVTSKKVRQYEDDDDDDDDDEDEEEDYEDDDQGDKDNEEEIEEIVEVQQVDPDRLDSGYAEDKPTIVTKKRRRKKHGKKHKPFKVKDFKKLKKFMLPLLLAYKLKFFTLVPLMLGGLVLIVATTGFAGFFFALFAVGLGLKGHR
ncbi:transcription initiation factor TFIID subunit 11 [Adelges cooleyi]|uniref:transcription initiation factor TFIID subunit 11 n=1 Tax=Adelges cooleyi TaxID=133065 RepID=UPI00217F51A7|nr:transcription initiation factor TFIID subunit 11 [Adelges cooleyi]